MSSDKGPRSAKDGPQVIEIDILGWSGKLSNELREKWRGIADGAAQRLDIPFQARNTDRGVAAAFLCANDAERLLTAIEPKLKEAVQKEDERTNELARTILRRYGVLSAHENDAENSPS